LIYCGGNLLFEIREVQEELGKGTTFYRPYSTIAIVCPFTKIKDARTRRNIAGLLLLKTTRLTVIRISSNILAIIE
jgi:hypothetical protein